MGRKRNRTLIKLNRWSTLIIVAGVTLLLYPLLTNLYAWYNQEQLVKEIVNNQVLEPDDDMSSGDFAGMLLEIADIELSVPVQKGTSADLLAVSPGWYTESALPGEGNTAIAGHRSMYGGPFRHLEDLELGAQIILKYQNRVYEYQVEKLYTVDNNDWSVIEPCGYTALTLTTCHQEGRAFRCVVRARLVNEDNDI